jgi:hypothetical protein
METIEQKHDLGRLERQITDLSKALKSLSDDQDLVELLKIIKRPGWTTPAEFVFVTGIAESLSVQVKAVQSLKKILVNGSRQVGV